MNLTPFPRGEILRALGVTPLRLRARRIKAQEMAAAKVAADVAPEPIVADRRVALLRSQAEIELPALAALYTRITEAISALGLQCVRLADAESDPRVRVLAFGDVPLSSAIESARVLRVDALTVLDSDRARKRALWELMQKLAREAG